MTKRWCVPIMAVAGSVIVAFSPASAQPPLGMTADMSFYAAPQTVPETPGVVIRSEPMSLPITLPGSDGPLPAATTRIMYSSTDRNGAAVPVTGAYLRPTLPWLGPGHRPLVVVAPGTQGQGDQCAPTNTLAYLLQYNGGLDVAVQYEQYAAIYPLLALGAAVVLTDHQGFGTPGAHPYLSRATSGHAVLDAARAARTLPGSGLEPTAPVGLWGYSQGGGSIAAAAELAATYAPELPIVGSYAGAPVVSAEAQLRRFDGGALTGAMGYYINGAIDENPALAPALDRLLTDAGKQMLADTSGQCVGETVLSYGFRDSRTWTTTGQPLATALLADPGWAAHIDGDRAGRLRPSAPVLIHATANDELVPVDTARRVAADWCGQGAQVTYQELPLPGDPVGLGVSHVLNSPLSLPGALLWMGERLAGRPAHSTC
ncbi:lipase family protein [Nocardia sp. NPDC058176]|uniref:lipase family protein n=1 Tax=Nocardia sp. NPDC058176 TaxID=3346368 RepID=UPI0036D9DF8A